LINQQPSEDPMTFQQLRQTPRLRHRAALAAVLAVAVPAVAACGSSNSSSSSSASAASSGSASSGSGSSGAASSGSTGSGSSGSAASSTSTGFKPINKGELTVGMDLQFKPEMYLKAGQPAGYDVDLLKVLAKQMGVKLNIQNIDFNGLIPGLQSNKYDLVSVGLSNTPARAKVVSFTRPYVPYAQVLGVPAKQASSITSASQLDQSGKTITALQGSTDQQLAQQVFSKATVTGYPDQNAAFLQVATGRANGIVAEDYLLAQYSASNPGQIAEAKLSKPLQVQYGSWATPQGNNAFIAYLNTFLCKEQTNGTLAKIYTKDEGTKTMPKMPACPAS
jgi:ABC-type amino acid transport substrate-binding protein